MSGDLLIWFKNYLSGRRQFVFVNNEQSDSGLVKAGVPRGSILGPLLFLLYDFNFLISPPCQTLSKAFEMSLNIKIVDNRSSKC
jgi:hypothetical protein